ncbi:DNA polymerase interacting tetratricopeptide repeat-containing, protein of 47 kDa [Anthonomus grandis grandis]|uniref:DNA polymerase interacting tetratricopeptide repeat-containing, protein of 47 kDa n=1 Tax=Anthonomus grandis grandis TaxID=2921223 RepID=UPI00216623CB|nr:DNA polymerase interacting tetratricopeptide repeat-containing, protein of 47 kDa [Anthonomus grandis grandis]XP_050311735.1 DNA polymerase interacting tetratricopeptide repeat-containing, protein of 47 kDa [Anthonomus grandis grandis]
MDRETQPKVKTPMTEAERLELAKKLDEELDEFINNLPRKKYEDGWPEDRWEEEMAKHPFFMKEAPKPGDKLHPLYEGLQKLKYDPEENEPEELAISYKEDGNFNFKHKNYRLAIVAYTEGLKQKCGNPEIEASLLNNRAASHWFLQNYRSCLKDCELALKHKPDYEKVLNRAAMCSYHMKQYEKAVEFCDRILQKNKTNDEILELRKNCVNEQKLKERNQRKKEIEEKKRLEEETSLVNEIIKRGYVIEGGERGNIHLSKLEPCFPELAQNRVFLCQITGCLVWPVVFVYPEYKIMDYLQQFSEIDTVYDQLKIVFDTYPEWDEKREYRPDNLNVYYEDDKQKLVKVDVDKCLEDVLKGPGYVIKGGTPSLIVLVKNSPIEYMLLNDQ